MKLGCVREKFKFSFQKKNVKGIATVSIFDFDML